MIVGKILNTKTSNLPDILISKEDFLGEISLSFEMMEVPSVALTLPISYTKLITGTSHIVLKSDDWLYEGYVSTKNNDYSTLTVTVNTSHIVGRLDKRNLPTNVTVRDRSVESTVEQVQGYWNGDKFKDDLLRQFKFGFVDEYAKQNKIDYEFSNESFLEFLTKLCEKTQAMYWRINRYDPYLIEFGIFGDKKDILINEYNYLVNLSDVVEEYEEVANIGVAMSDKSDGGASSLTLRDIFYNKGLEVPGFPVIKTGNKVNSQRSYDYPQLPVFAPEVIGDEFAIMDEVGVALEAGEFYWKTITDNDTQAIAEDNKEITDQDRIRATIQLYNMAIRRLINSRRRITYSMVVSPLKRKTVQIGDRVMFKLDTGVWTLTACSKYYEKILKQDDWFFVTSIRDVYDTEGGYTQELTLSKELYSNRDIKAGA